MCSHYLIIYQINYQHRHGMRTWRIQKAAKPVSPLGEILSRACSTQYAAYAPRCCCSGQVKPAICIACDMPGGAAHIVLHYGEWIAANHHTVIHSLQRKIPICARCSTKRVRPLISSH